MNKDIMNSIEKNDVISFVGGGGKTTIMFSVAFEAAKLGLKVLVTTTTKIFMPEEHYYEEIVLRETISSNKTGTCYGITVFGDRNINGKIIATNEGDLKSYIESESFDLVLIEADGSRRKSLKAYRENEPLVPLYSNKVFAVVSLDAIGVLIDERYIYNSKRVSDILGKEAGSSITKDDIVTLIESKEGFFENLFNKDKYIVLTKCVNKERREYFEFILKKLNTLEYDIKTYINY